MVQNVQNLKPRTVKCCHREHGLTAAAPSESSGMPGGNRRDQETQALNYVLSLWSGSNEKILDNITGEGRELMATAESVFQKAAEELEDGTIVIGQLELILKHKRQFVDIWNLSKYEAEIVSTLRSCGLLF